MSLDVVARILSFWRFVASSTVKSFSSEKIILLTSSDASRRRSPLHISTRFWRRVGVRRCAVFLFKDFSPKSSLTTFLRDSRLTPRSFAIFRIERLGFRATRLLTAFLSRMDLVVQGSANFWGLRAAFTILRLSAGRKISTS